MIGLYPYASREEIENRTMLRRGRNVGVRMWDVGVTPSYSPHPIPPRTHAASKTRPYILTKYPR